jgi:hypothetical protein
MNRPNPIEKINNFDAIVIKLILLNNSCLQIF